MKLETMVGDNDEVGDNDDAVTHSGDGKVLLKLAAE